MGQSASRRVGRRAAATTIPSLSIFPTNLGWFGLLGEESHLVSVLAGHASANDVRRALSRQSQQSAGGVEVCEEDWDPDLRLRLERYGLGEPIDFADVPLAMPPATDFQSRVIKIARRIPYGKTISYGRLAEKAGFPRAARAVGSVMSCNRFPIVIPCHRVVAAGGKPGGYTSAQGLDLKLRLLAMEAATTGH